MVSKIYVVETTDNNPRAFCKVCNKLFTVSHGGENSIKKHASVTQHQQLHIQVSQNQLLSMFLTS
jgi:hypothetical protein